MIKKFVPALLTLLVSAAVQATPVAGVSISNITTFSGDGPWTLGYRFTAVNSITVTALGAFDLGGDGFLNSHAVGLWTTSGILLASTTVTSGDSLLSDFRYGSIAGVALTAGQDYIVGAADFGGSGQDTYALTATVTSAPDVSYVGSQYMHNGGLLFPANANGNNSGYYGGNFLYEATTNVPEPTTLALLGVAMAGLALTRRRRA